ncbi:MAG: valine--tRNA ligase, partial [Oscillospiraceae bacterium]|nr:valine--tRNA ligase [Oscillospiraceae bacterium]
MRELEKTYDPKLVEDRIYKMWEDGGYFVGHIDPDKKPFTIVIPPPNVTGQLHLGHAFDNTIQDILIRYKRMQGFAALWVPGTDHAGIATQIKVEEDLRNNEGLTRQDIGREAFLERVWAWKELYGSRIIEQLKKMGSSCDWTRERFTMDEGCSRAVREVFVLLYERGLIYKGLRIINWCPSCRTALSDAEVEHEERESLLYYLSYPVSGSSDTLVVATTRPETMLGDTAVAINPDDKRYKHLVGRTAILPLMNRELRIIADDYVDSEFGTGCVKITPMHDPNDFDIGQRHNLDQILVIDEDAKIINSGVYNGLERYEARKKVLADLEALGLLVKTEDHTLNIGTCHRCHTVVEPVASEQWFVKMKPLTVEATRVVDDGTIKFVPERFKKIYTHWMDNVRDWCISRQLWWGHRIPAWYCSCGHITISRFDPEVCEKCNSPDIKQDEDVLDTWFSSALWPFSTLGWPENTEDLQYFYPTSVLSCGVDIIFFWVARMIFSGMEFMREAPFETVAIHGMIRDNLGRVMSKSAGNGVDPIDIIDTYGADALRFYIVSGNSPGNDMRYYPERCEAMRNFANKIWNAARYVLMRFDDNSDNKHENIKTNISDIIRLPLELEDKWILSKLNTLASEICDNLDKFELGIAAAKVYDFIWDDFCDWYIEITKPRFANTQITSELPQDVHGTADDNSNTDIVVRSVLLYIVKDFLTILHPFMPFITEEIWQALPHSENVLMMRQYPSFNEQLSFPKEEADFESIMSAINAVRSRRAELNVPPSKRAKVIIISNNTSLYEAGRAYISRLAYADDLVIVQSLSDAGISQNDLDNYVTAVTNDARIYMPLSELVDINKERERLNREITKA